LPDRFEVVALADRLAVAAVKTPTRERAATLVQRAAALRLRLFRVFHGESDGHEAAALLERAVDASAGKDACLLALERAALAGELARDPAVSSREIQAAAARWRDPTCGKKAEAMLAALGGYLPGGGGCPGVVGAGGSARAPAASAGIEEVVASPDPPTATGPASILAVEPYGDKESARIVVRLSNPASFQVGAAPAVKGGPSHRVYVDLARTRLGKHRREIAVGGLVERVRLGPHEGGARVVLDLKQKAVRRVFYLPEPFRVVIDVSTRPLGEAPVNGKGKRQLSRVALDPGHGGSDPGATGPSGLQEKDVTLDIAHRAASVLARELRISTLVTRDRDEYVALEERTARANAYNADLFVSIHCNASESGAAHGVQTYVLDTTSDEIAARVAARENNASLAQAGPDVARLLSNLRLADNGARSTHLAELLQRAAVASLGEKFPGVSDQGVKTAGFYVLVGAQMPAVLFETSFISNATEEERLKTADYRQRLADAIVNAIKAYRDGFLLRRFLRGCAEEGESGISPGCAFPPRSWRSRCCSSAARPAPSRSSRTRGSTPRARKSSLTCCCGRSTALTRTWGWASGGASPGRSARITSSTRSTTASGSGSGSTGSATRTATAAVEAGSATGIASTGSWSRW
jgi:N-acetylmuramoyl-L-alanine amidase